MQWYVIAIDWKRPNIIDGPVDESLAKKLAKTYDELALRAIAVPENDPRLMQ